MISRVHQRGYTLVEIMLSIVIFTAGIIVIMSLFPISLQDVTRARIMTQAAFLGQGKMEEILAIPGTLIPESFDKAGKFEPEFPEFTYVARKYPFTYTEDGKKVESVAMYEIYVAVFHTINNRKAPLVEYYAIKGGLGEQKHAPGVP